MQNRDLVQSGTSGEVRWQWCRVLGEGENEYKKVKGYFLDGIGAVDLGSVVTGIHKVTKCGNMHDERVSMFEKEMLFLKDIRGDANIRFGRYGTSEEGVQMVLSLGFPLPSKVEGAYGVGVYLSPVRVGALWSAMFSEVDEYGEKHVILCTVLLENSEKIEAGSHQVYPSSIDFDTGVDDLLNPNWYVVLCDQMNYRILPSYVVSYRPSIELSGQSTGTLDLEFILNSSLLTEKLFAKLGNTFPSSRVEEFQTLCYAYKDGTVTKDDLIAQFQSSVGDEMLASAIRELRD